jgi:beta-hydroxyacyl-ACP dehydratase FabZ
MVADKNDAPKIPAMPMDTTAIQRCIPHRFPFLLVDRILEVTPGERIVSQKNISFSDPVLQGHFPDNPVYPGVMIVEVIAQSAAIFGYMTAGGTNVCYLTEIQSARFRRPVVPGDVLRVEALLIKQRAPFFWFDATCTVDGEVVVQVKLSALMK